MKVRILGCSGGIGAGLRSTSILIDDDILIDAGTGLGDLTLEEMGSIRHIFVTHSHLDHVCFLPLLIDTIFDVVTEPVIIHSQQETLQALQDYIFNWVVWPDFAELPRPDAPVLSYKAMKPGDVWKNNGRTIEAIQVNHIVPAVGYRVDDGAHSFAFSGDTCTNETFWKALNAHSSLDLLIIEAAFADHNIELSKMAKHYCPATLAEDMKKLEHQPDVFISHRKPGEEERILRECREQMPERNLEGLSDGRVFKL